MATSIVHGKYLISKVTDTGEAVAVENGAVFQRDGTIVEIGSYEVLSAKYRADETIGSVDHVVMPGFVNAHHHVGVTPFQLGAPDAPLELWSVFRSGARDVDVYLDTLYSAFEMIESGVTTVQHLHGVRRGPVTGWPHLAQQVLQAYRDIGMRVSYAFGMRDQNRLVYGADDEFVSTLPAHLASDVAAWLKGATCGIADVIQWLFVDLYESCGANRGERMRLWLAPVNLQWCSDEALVAVKECSRQYGVGIHMHLLETPYQRVYALRRFGVSAVQHLRDIGFLGEDVTLGHGVWLTEKDVQVLVETGTSICHNASSNLRLQSGTAPLNYLTQRGVRVALGIDEAGINDDRDMLQEMRLVLKLHRVPGMTETVPTAARVFQMATSSGAHVTGFGNRIGALEPGRGADMVVMNLRNIMGPYLDADVPVVDAVLHRGRSRDVETVIIGGDVVLREGVCTRVEKARVLAELASSLRVPLRPDEIRRKELSQELLPHVRRFYEGWLDETGEPYYRVNRRR